MKNKTIEILAEGSWNLPIGTLYTLRDADGGIRRRNKTETPYSIGAKELIHEVDFSDLPPLYPTKGMEVGKDGIEFADGNGKLLDVGVNGFTHGERITDAQFVYWYESFGVGMELKRTLPKTIAVCAECFKETCECKHEMTPLDVMYFWEVVKANSSILLSHMDDVEIYDLSFDFRVDSIVSEWRWNEIVRINGITKLKYDEWKEFTFDNCLMSVTPGGEKQ